MSEAARRLLAAGAWLAACVALLPTGAAVIVATLRDGLTRWALAGLPLTVLVVLGLLAWGRGRVVVGLLPVTLVLYAASLPEHGREALVAPGAWLVSFGGLSAMTLAVLALERPAALRVGEPIGRGAGAGWLERARASAAVLALVGAGGAVLWSGQGGASGDTVLALAAVAFLWSLGYYVYFAIPLLNGEFERAQLEAQRRSATALRWTGVRATGALALAVGAAVGAAAAASP